MSEFRVGKPASEGPKPPTIAAKRIGFGHSPYYLSQDKDGDTIDVEGCDCASEIEDPNEALEMAIMLLEFVNYKRQLAQYTRDLEGRR